MKAILVLLVPVLAGCAHQYIEVAQWHTESSAIIQNSPTTVSLVTESEDGRVFCEARHLSSIHNGRPFNASPETVFDMVGCGFRAHLR